MPEGRSRSSARGKINCDPRNKVRFAKPGLPVAVHVDRPRDLPQNVGCAGLLLGQQIGEARGQLLRDPVPVRFGGLHAGLVLELPDLPFEDRLLVLAFSAGEMREARVSIDAVAAVAAPRHAFSCGVMYLHRW